MGTLTKEGVLDRRMVWSAFGTWITAYYTFMKEPEDLLARWREESRDPLIFAGFEWLALEMIRFDRRSAPSPAGAGTAITDARSVLENETHLKGPNGTLPDGE